MNIVWTSIIIVGLSMLLFQNVDLAFSSIVTGSEKAIELSLKLWAIYTIWLGLLKIVEDTKLDEKISKLLSKIIDKLIGKTDSYTKNQIAINLSSNILGMGNASTPSGINAMKGLEDGSKYATTSMIMLMILNTSSLQILPTTVIGLRIFHMSLSPADIIIPTLFATICSTFSGIALVLICSKIFKKRINLKDRLFIKCKRRNQK